MAKLAGADLSGCEMSEVDLTSADLTDTKLSGTQLSGANLDGARGGRAQRVAVMGPDGSESLRGTLTVGRPVVFALTAARALRLDRVLVQTNRKDSYCPKNMEVLAGPSAEGPWTSLLAFTGQRTRDEQTFAAPAGTPAITGFVQVVVHDTYGNQAEVMYIALEGEAWGPAA